MPPFQTMSRRRRYLPFLTAKTETLMMVQHAERSSFGPFSPDQAGELVRTLRKSIGKNTRSVILLGCHVEKSFAKEVEKRLKKEVSRRTSVLVVFDASSKWVHKVDNEYEIKIFQDGTFEVMEEESGWNSGKMPITSIHKYLKRPKKLHRKS